MRQSARQNSLDRVSRDLWGAWRNGSRYPVPASTPRGVARARGPTAYLRGLRRTLPFTEPWSSHPPNHTYLIPPMEIAAGPVWALEDLVRFAQEIGHKRRPAGK